jgi:hypothetical protein
MLIELIFMTTITWELTPFSLSKYSSRVKDVLLKNLKGKRGLNRVFPPSIMRNYWRKIRINRASIPILEVCFLRHYFKVGLPVFYWQIYTEGDSFLLDCSLGSCWTYWAATPLVALLLLPCISCWFSKYRCGPCRLLLPVCQRRSHSDHSFAIIWSRIYWKIQPNISDVNLY